MEWMLRRQAAVIVLAAIFPHANQTAPKNLYRDIHAL